MTQEKASVKLSTKKWHYKLVQFILGGLAPTPQNMHNLCPYFWLVIFSMMVTPVYGPLKLIALGFAKGLDTMANLMDKYLIIPAADAWGDKLTDLDAWQILSWDYEIKKIYRTVYGDNDNWMDKERFVYDWWRTTYKKKVFANEKEGQTYGKYTKGFESWYDACREEADRIGAEARANKLAEQEKKQRYENKMRNFRDNTDAFFDDLRDKIYSWKSIIKWTKRTLGLIVTVAGLVGVYFIVNFAGRGVLWLVENWNWDTFVTAMIVLASLGAGIGIVWLLGLWIKYIEAKGALNIWYIKLLYYLTMIVWWPCKVIFYRFLWQLVLVNLWFFIKRGARLVWGSILGFLGIFGEYFGASYSDYCPGIDWEENE